MVDTTLLFFVFLQGIVMFFAPCAVALLPAYIAHFIASRTKHQSITAILKVALTLSALAILAFTIVFGLTAILLFSIANIMKAILPWVVIVLGVGLIIMGIFALLGKNISLNLHMHNNARGEKKEAFVFGIVYALGALGCLFPLFMSVVTIGMASGSLLGGIIVIAVYIAGMSCLLVTTILLAAFARDWLQRTLRSILPYINRISGMLLIGAGIYVIWYQSVLVF